MKDIGKFIRERRKELCLSLQKVADYVGVSDVSVLKWETGDTKRIRQDRLKKLAEILQCSPLDLMDLSDVATAQQIVEMRDKFVSLNRGQQMLVEETQEMQDEDIMMVLAIVKAYKNNKGGNK